MAFMPEQQQFVPSSTAATPGMDIPPGSEYEMPPTEVYHTGGYWLAGTQMMNYACSNDALSDVSFDPLEELVWCISRMGQLTAFYSVSMERYITTTIPLSPVEHESGTTTFSELKQIFPSPRHAEHSVYVLASNALLAYTKFGVRFSCATDEQMANLECLAVTGPTGASPGCNGSWVPGSEADYARFFLGGLQPSLLELDATDRWGQVIRAIDVGSGGSVVLRSFRSGLCAGTTNGKVMVIDPRTSKGIVRDLDAHTGEISDIAVVSSGYTLVTCGWSRVGDSRMRVDRLLKVYDLRSGRAQVPLTTYFDAAYVRFYPGCNDRLLTASQTGAFRTVQWGNRTVSPSDLGQLWPSYDRLVALDISSNSSCLVFGTETGHLQLYLSDMNRCQFNAASLPTEFASPLAEGLWPTNNLGGAAPPTYPLMLMDDPANPLQGTNLMSMAKAAADGVELQLLTQSLHQPAPFDSEQGRATAEAYTMLERRKAEAATEAVMLAYKPIEYDDYRFSFSSIPFCANPPTTEDSASALPLGGGEIRKPLSLSDWPEDLCPSRPRRMLRVPPELVAQANDKGVVRKPSHWGRVWHPYSADSALPEEEDTTFGRFIDVPESERVGTVST